MPLEMMIVYVCSICGNAMTGMEWGEQLDKAINGKDYCCPDCGHGMNEDELYGEED
jgi:DNA-directed RNA polymerase subunit RPC12/RpoP